MKMNEDQSMKLLAMGIAGLIILTAVALGWFFSLTFN